MNVNVKIWPVGVLELNAWPRKLPVTAVTVAPQATEDYRRRLTKAQEAVTDEPAANEVQTPARVAER